MKYKLLIIWDDGDITVSSFIQDSYEGVRYQAKHLLDIDRDTDNNVAHLGWIEWDEKWDGEANSRDVARICFFKKESLHNGPDRSQT